MTEAQGRVGRWLRNKWHLDSLIAIGGMAAVYASTHRNGARAAIKMLHSQYTRNEQARRRFLAEGYAANKVGHRNAVLVLDDDTTEDGEVYLVMELLEGESLEGRLERLGVMGPMEVLELTDQLLEVLASAHPQGILHRDIKPANIYLTRDGAVKLLDFGLAQVRELSAEAMDQSDGIVFGTVSYIAPEQARADNQNLDARSDLWSIAATMFRALSGETVHPSTGPIIDRLMAVARKPPRSLASVCPGLPRPVIELVDRALAFDPDVRWPSANVMRVVVQDVLAQLREEAGEEVEEPPPPSSGVFGRRTQTSRPQTGGDLPRVRPPTPPTPPAPGADERQRQRTDPMALSMRPQSLPAYAVPSQAPAVSEPPRSEEAPPRRSRTLLTKEGRAELRRILDAKKANLGLAEPRDEETPAFTTNVPRSNEPGEPGEPVEPDEPDEAGDVDVSFDDSFIEVTIDHTHAGRPGAIAEPLADPVTPAPMVLPHPVLEDRLSAGPARSTGSYPPVGSPPAVGRVPDPPPMRGTGSHAAVGSVTRPVPVLEDRQARATSASYPSLGGASSRPIEVAAEPSFAAGDNSGPRAVSGEIQSGPASAPDEVVGRAAPVIVSGEIVSEPIRAAEITRIGPAPAAPETIASPRRAPDEITRVGPAPAPPPVARPADAVRAAAVTTGLNETIRPKTIPPVSTGHRPAQPVAAREPVAPMPVGSGAFARPQSKPEGASESGVKRASFARAGVFAAPPMRNEPDPPKQPGLNDTMRPSMTPPRPPAGTGTGEGQRPVAIPPRAAVPPAAPPASAPVLKDSKVGVQTGSYAAVAPVQPDRPASRTAAASAVGMPGPRRPPGPAIAARTSPEARISGPLPAAASAASPSASTSVAPTPAAPAAAPAVGQPVPKDIPAKTPSEAAAARATAPTVANPTVADPTVADPTVADPAVADPAVSGTPARRSNESRAKTGAVPVLPFSFLRAAAPARPSPPASAPPDSDDDPTRKKP